MVRGYCGCYNWTSALLLYIWFLVNCYIHWKLSFITALAKSLIIKPWLYLIFTFLFYKKCETPHLPQLNKAGNLLFFLPVPPHAEVSGFNRDWFVGLENAALRCVSGGNPKPQSFTWFRYSRACLPLWLSGNRVTNCLMRLVTVTFLITSRVIMAIIFTSYKRANWMFSEVALRSFSGPKQHLLLQLN